MLTPSWLKCKSQALVTSHLRTQQEVTASLIKKFERWNKYVKKIFSGTDVSFNDDSEGADTITVVN
jgi:hypothetical protein